jgi:hypothetical protein
MIMLKSKPSRVSLLSSYDTSELLDVILYMFKQVKTERLPCRFNTPLQIGIPILAKCSLMIYGLQSGYVFTEGKQDRNQATLCQKSEPESKIITAFSLKKE